MFSFFPSQPIILDVAYPVPCLFGKESQELTPEVVDSVIELYLCLQYTKGFKFVPLSSSKPLFISNVFDSDNDRL